MRNGKPRTRIVDVAINVFGKPAQTALTLVSLLRHSDRWIDRIYFNEEPNAVNEAYSHGDLQQLLGDRLVLHRPAVMNWRYALDRDRLGDEAYRHSLRYQFAFERTDKNFLLVVHNDCEFVDDVVGHLLGAIDGYVGAGEVGQCHLCPAARLGQCGPGRHLDYRPQFAELDPAVYRRRYLDEPAEDLVSRPWPLPECRLNEYCCLLNMTLARPATAPLGPALPFGAYLDVGNPETGQGILDIGVAWFRDMIHMGLMVRHVPLGTHVLHSGGWKALFDTDLYVEREEKALAILAEKYR